MTSSILISPNSRRPWVSRLVGPLILFIICAGFFWKLVLTNQYTWFDSPDLTNMILPWYQLEAGEWHQGRVPLWDPHLWGGQPLLGQAEPGVAYPLNWLLFLLPLRDGWIRQSSLHWYFVIIHYMAALFCYWLCRDLKRSQAASIIAGAAFGLGGYLGSTEWPYMLNGAVWAPLVLLFLLRALRGEHPLANSAASGVFLGMSWLSGHHQIPIFVCLAVAGVWLYYIFKSGWPDWRLVRLGAVFTLFLILVSGVQALPAYEYGKLALRWINLESPVGWKEAVPYLVHDRYSLHPMSLLGIVVPGLYPETDPLIGVVGLTLALLGLALGWKHRPVRIFAAIAAGGLLFALGKNNVFHGIIYALVPLVEKARNAGMAVYLFHFGSAVLIAFGIDSIVAERGSPWLRRAAIIVAVLGTLLLFLLLTLALVQKAPGDERVGVTALVALLLAPVLYGWREGRLSQTTAASLSLMLMLIEIGNFTGYFWPNRADKQRNTYVNRMRENADIAEFLRQQPWPLRFEVSDKEIPFNFGDWYGIDQFGGFQASLLENFMRVEPHLPRTHRLFGVTYSLGREPPGPNQEEVFQGASGLKVYRNNDAFPRVWTVHEAMQIKNIAEAGSIMHDEGFDLRRKTFLLGPAPPMERCEAGDSVVLLGRSSGRVTIEANMGCRGMVVASESYFPGWHATVDGKPANIYEAYTAIRGVMVDSGHHIVEMKYRPRSAYLGAFMTLTGFLGAAILGIWSVRRRRSGQTKEFTH